MAKPVPVNIVTGFLGAGKTTAIRCLLTSRPAGERWALIVNEFGAIGIDGLDMAGEGPVRTIAGGCLCCVASPGMALALRDILRQQPDRILIEPSGLGHPAGLFDLLREAERAGSIELRATLCLVDPRKLADPRLTDNETFIDQAQMADVLLASKSDLASDDDRIRFQAFADALYPAKLHVALITDGVVEPGLLDLASAGGRAPLFPDLHRDAPAAPRNGPIPLPPGPCAPLFQTATSLGHHYGGWLFSPDDLFDRGKVLALLRRPDLSSLMNVASSLRIKAVLRTGRTALLIDRVDGEVTQRAVAWRRDSRLECIVPDGGAMPDWPTLQAALLGCLQPPRAAATALSGRVPARG
jgi:G3E family GTPase